MAARAFVKNLNPSFYMRHYHSQFAWWDNDLNKEFRTRIEGTLSLKRTRTALTVGVENIKNYAYFATDKIAYNDEWGAIRRLQQPYFRQTIRGQRTSVQRTA